MGRSGKDQITRPRNGHDDVANAAAGALVHAARPASAMFDDLDPKLNPWAPRTFQGCGQIFYVRDGDQADRCPACTPGPGPAGPSWTWQDLMRGGW